MAPPELARDAPILKIRHPVVVDLGPALGVKLHAALIHHGVRSLAARVAQPPLLGEPRLDWHIRALGEADVVLVRLLFDERAELAQALDRRSTRLEAIEPDERLARERVHRPVWIHD